MSKETYIGFDSAWAGKVPGALCTMTVREGTLIRYEPPRLVGFVEAAAVIEEEASSSDYVLIALDQPTLVPNVNGMRPVEPVAGNRLRQHWTSRRIAKGSWRA